MHRLQIQLTDEQARRLREHASAQRTSLAGAIRGRLSINTSPVNPSAKRFSRKPCRPSENTARENPRSPGTVT